MSINKFLSQVFRGANHKDYTHASDTFVSNQFELQPRHKHLFHVMFNFAPHVPRDFDRDELFLLVKSIDLPQFQMDVEDRNQYNKHRFTQHKINYQDVNITFHDDAADNIRNLWHSYYKYYFQDGNYGSPGNGTLDKAYTTDDIYTDRINSSVPFGMDRGPLNEGKQFFSDIRIYSMQQKKYVETTLINPIITAFGHDKHDYATGDPMEHQMTIKYETVRYASGYIGGNGAPAFGDHHYDTQPSPLSVAGGGTTSIFGNGGLFDAANTIAGDLGKGNGLGAILGAGRLIANSKGTDFKQLLLNEGKQAFKDVLRGKNPSYNKVFPNITDSFLKGQKARAKTMQGTNPASITSEGVKVGKPWVNPDAPVVNKGRVYSVGGGLRNMKTGEALSQERLSALKQQLRQTGIGGG